MPSKVSKTKLKMRMTRTTSAKMESSSQPPAKTIKTSIESFHHVQRQRSQEHRSVSSDSNEVKKSKAPSTESNVSTKDPIRPSHNSKSRIQKPPSKGSKGHPDDKSSHTSSSSDEKHCELDGPIYKRYTIKKRLGKGAYGIVWEAYEKSSGNKVALKKIFDAFRNDTDAQRTYREITFLREFGSHPNIIRLLNVHRAVNNMDIYLVFPFMEHDLHRLIKDSPHVLKDSHIRMIFYQTLKAVKYLHSGEVIHRDLKPANILLDDCLNVKVADFGLARSLSNPEDAMSETNPVMTDYVATRWYRPPEILLSCHYYTKGVDMWSLGCILGEMILKVPLFPGGSTVHQVETIMSHIAQPTSREIEEMCGRNVHTTMIESAMTYRKKSLAEIFERSDVETQDLLEKFLIFNPDKRITAEETLAHPYLARYRRPAEEIVMSHPVSPPLNDYIQLSMCQYRSVIYDLIQVRKVRQQQSQRAESPVPTPISKSKSYSQPGAVTRTAPGGSSQNNLNEPRRIRSTNEAGSTTAVSASKSKPNCRKDNERDGRKGCTVKTVQTLSRERVLTATSCDYSGRMVKAETRTTDPEGDGNGSRKARNHVGVYTTANNSTLDVTTDKPSLKSTRKNNSTSNIPQARKIPGPDGDGHDLPLPYLKLVSTAPSFQAKNPRLFDRSELSARTNHPVPCDLRGADKRLFERFSNTDDLEDEIKAIEFQVRAKRVNTSTQAQWITELSNNLNKATVSDPPNNYCNMSQNTGARDSKTGGNPNTKVRSHHQTKLPEILQSWNYGQNKVMNNTGDLGMKQGRRSTYFQDPAAGYPNTNSSKLASGVGGQRNVGTNRLIPFSPRECTQQRHPQLQLQQQYNQSVEFTRSTTPTELIQARNKHFESYSQTHGTISASDLCELKANIGFIGKSS